MRNVQSGQIHRDAKWTCRCNRKNGDASEHWAALDGGG